MRIVGIMSGDRCYHTSGANISMLASVDFQNNSKSFFLPDAVAWCW